jgi:hypothetical protein
MATVYASCTTKPCCPIPRPRCFCRLTGGGHAGLAAGDGAARSGCSGSRSCAPTLMSDAYSGSRRSRGDSALARGFTRPPGITYVVHGEAGAAEALRTRSRAARLERGRRPGRPARDALNARPVLRVSSRPGPGLAWPPSSIAGRRDRRRAHPASGPLSWPRTTTTRSSTVLLLSVPRRLVSVAKAPLSPIR